MTISHSGAILEKGSRRIMQHLGKRAVHWVRQTGEGKEEEKREEEKKMKTGEEEEERER